MTIEFRVFVNAARKQWDVVGKYELSLTASPLGGSPTIPNMGSYAGSQNKPWGTIHELFI